MSRWEYQTLIYSGMSASELLGKRRYIFDDDMSAMVDTLRAKATEILRSQTQLAQTGLLQPK